MSLRATGRISPETRPEATAQLQPGCLTAAKQSFASNLGKEVGIITRCYSTKSLLRWNAKTTASTKGRKRPRRVASMTYNTVVCVILLVAFELRTVVCFSSSVPGKCAFQVPYRRRDIICKRTHGFQAPRSSCTSMFSLACDHMELSKGNKALANTTLAPVYITIGPPCGGKSEALRRQAQRDGYLFDSADDRAADNNGDFGEDSIVELQEQADGVYQRVPLAAFLFPNSTKYLDPQLGDETVLHSGMTVRERLLHPSPPPLDETDLELRNVILRVAGRMTADDFAERIRRQQAAMISANSPSYIRQRREAMAEDLIQAVEAVSVQAVGEVLMQMQFVPTNNERFKATSPSVAISTHEDEDDLPYHENHEDDAEKGLPMENAINESTYNLTEAPVSAHLLSAKALIGTPFVDIFVPHALFSGGINAAEKRLETLLYKDQNRCQPVSWGNTNTRPVEYVPALKAAQKAGRPVKFVCWGTPEMPKVPRKKLLRRNVQRFRATGRYVPAGAIAAALGRVEKLLREAGKATKRRKLSNDDVVDDGDALDIALAAMAGFAMDRDGHVVQIGEPLHLGRQKHKSRQTTKKWDV